MESKSNSFTDAVQVAKLQSLKVIDKYVIKNHLLGQGSYAKTYIALKSNTDIMVCKMISKNNLIQKINKSSDKQFTKDFLTTSIRNEVNVWGKLKHKNIAHFYDYRQTENNVYFFIQYCADGTLEALVSNFEIDLPESLKIFKQIVEGCSYLFDMGILHRDLKPENIMIHKGTVKIADFGFSELTKSQSMKTQCLERYYIGTPLYMSPQGLMKKPYSIKCDVWSIGIIFYRLLCGTLPFKKLDNIQSFIQSIKIPPCFPASIQKIPKLKSLILRMLSFSQEDRIGIKQIEKQLQSIEQCL